MTRTTLWAGVRGFHQAFGRSGTTVAVVILGVLVLAASFPATSRADPAPVWNPENGHYYEAMATDNIGWTASRDAAAARSYAGCAGHLATITKPEEMAFIVTNFPQAMSRSYYLGGYQLPASKEPDGGWTWITGEPWEYTGWAPGEPNNNGPAPEAYLQLCPGGWNDTWERAWYYGYVVEYECLDADGDGVADEADNCPRDSNLDRADLDGDGQGDVCDADDDGDGVADVVDACPREHPGGADADRDGCIDRVDHLADLIRGLGLPAGIESALVHSALAASASVERGQYDAARGQLRALANKLIGMQRGKVILPATADMLLAYIANVVAALP